MSPVIAACPVSNRVLCARKRRQGRLPYESGYLTRTIESQRRDISGGVASSRDFGQNRCKPGGHSRLRCLVLGGMDYLSVDVFKNNVLTGRAQGIDLSAVDHTGRPGAVRRRGRREKLRIQDLAEILRGPEGHVPA